MENYRGSADKKACMKKYSSSAEEKVLMEKDHVSAEKKAVWMKKVYTSTVVVPFRRQFLHLIGVFVTLELRYNCL